MHAVKLMAAGTVSLILSWLMLPSETVRAQESPPSSVTVEWFVDSIQECDLAEFERGTAYFTRQACQKLVELDRKPEALKLWERAFAALKASNGDAESYDLLHSALEMDRMDLAERILAEADSQKNSMLDQMALAKYKAGDVDALAGYPHGAKMMTFYDAVDLGHTYIAVDQLDKLEELLTDLEITEENEPEDVAGILYKHIARTARDKGDLDRAREYIDKAFNVAGRQFYTGYTIDVVRRSIHGNLVKDVDDLAELAERYRGHMARELLQWLISELVSLDEFALAEKVAERLDDPEDKSRVMMSIAKGQAQRGDYRLAMGLMRRLESGQSQDLVRLEIAKALFRLGKLEAAMELADFARNRMQPTKEYNSLYASLAEFEGMIGDPVRINRVLEATDAPYRRALRLLSALGGYMATQSADSE